MDEQARQLKLHSLTARLADHLESLRDALTDLSLSLKDHQLQSNPAAAGEAARLTEVLLKKCASAPTPPADPLA